MITDAEVLLICDKLSETRLLGAKDWLQLCGILDWAKRTGDLTAHQWGWLRWCAATYRSGLVELLEVEASEQSSRSPFMG